MNSTDRTFGGRYKLLERVGSGGMAEVYRARDELLGREVAVKVLSERLSSDRAFVDRFRREAQSAANLNHPNIVSLYDYGSDAGTYYIVMEFIEGRSLDDIIAAEAPLLPERAAEIAGDVAKALSRAHTAGIVHRDIKPGNVMITTSGQTKVTDFGIARALGGDGDQTMTQTGMVMGTAAYLSPEQAQGSPVDARSDVYSLGVVLYEMLTARPPFSGDTPLAVAYKHVRETPAAPGTMNNDIAPELNSIVMKALAKNPDNRYATATEMQEDLDRYRAGQTVLATPLAAETTVAPAAGGTQVMSATEIYDEPPPRRAGLYVAITLGVLLLLGLLAYLLAGNLFGGKKVDVPQVVGLQLDDARSRLDAANLEVETTRRPSKKPTDQVLKQDPEAGDEAREGDTVSLIVSGGVKRVEVPQVVGLSQEEAEQELKDADLEVGDIRQESDPEAEAGEVLEQTIAAGVEVNAGTEVGLVVASGTVTVPSVIGLPQDDAEAQIEAAGLVAEVTTTPSDEPEGRVVEQDPTGGSEAESGDTVRISVSEGQQEREMPDVTGRDADDAQAFLEDEYGLSVDQTDETEACAQPPGTVCRQDPDPGTPVSEGDSATLYVQPGGGALLPTQSFFAGLIRISQLFDIA